MLLILQLVLLFFLTRAFQLVTCRYELVTHEFELATRRFELVICEIKLVTCKSELANRIFKPVFYVSTRYLCVSLESHMGYNFFS